MGQRDLDDSTLPCKGERGEGGLRSTSGGGGGRGRGGAWSSSSSGGGGGGGGGSSSSSCSSSGGGGRAGGSSLLREGGDEGCGGRFWESRGSDRGITVGGASSLIGELSWGLLEWTGDCGVDDSSGTGVSAGCSGVVWQESAGGGGNGSPLVHSCTRDGRCGN